MPLGGKLAAFEKTISGNNAANNGTDKKEPPRRKWGKPASSGGGSGSTNGSSSAPKWGQAALKKSSNNSGSSNNSNNSNNNNNNDSSSSLNKFSLRKTPSSNSDRTSSSSTAYNLKKVEQSLPQKQQEEEPPPPPPPPEPEQEVAIEEMVEKSPQKEEGDSTVSTADMTEKLEASGDTKEDSTVLTEDDIKDDDDDENEDDDDNNISKPAAKKRGSSKNKKKSSSSKNKKKTKNEGSVFALEEGEYLKEVPPELRTKGTFDWSGVRSVINNISSDKKLEKKREKLQQKLDNINATREDALKMMQQHVQEQKEKMDAKRDEIRQKLYASMNGMTFTEMVEKVKEQHDIVASLKKSNNKLRLDTTKMMQQVKHLRVNNMKLEAANEQSQAVLEQLRERKKSVDARYEHLTKVIIPPYQERIKEMEEVVEERKLYGHNEHRTRVRYGNYIIRFLDKIENSDESEKLKKQIWEMAKDVEGGQLAELSDEEESDKSHDDIADMTKLTAAAGNASAASMNDSFQLGDVADADNNNSKSSSNLRASSSNLQKSTSAKEEKSLWDRYGSGSKSAGMNASSSNIGGGGGGKNADLLQKVNRAKAANFNGAVILSDSSDSDDDDSDDDDDDSDDVSLSGDSDD